MWKKNKDFFDFVKKGYPSLYSMLAKNAAWTGKNGGEFFLHQAFKTAGESFAVFDQDQRSVIVPWGEGKEITEKLIRSNGDVSKKVYDAAKPYTVSVFPYQLERLSACEAVTPIGDGQIWILDEKYYNNDTGIILPKKGEEICDTLIL